VLTGAVRSISFSLRQNVLIKGGLKIWQNYKFLTVGIVSGKVSEEVKEHAAGRRGLRLWNSASSASPSGSRVQTLFVVLIVMNKLNSNSLIF